jgi:hypothetical protein
VPWRRVLANRYVVVFGLLVVVTVAWNVYVSLHNDGLVTGRVVGADGAPVGGATVTLYEQTLTTLEPRATAVTGEDGRFHFDGQRAHHFVLVAAKNGAGASPRLAHRRYFRGQNVALSGALRLAGP